MSIKFNINEVVGNIINQIFLCDQYFNSFTMKNFRNGTSRILVSTDIISRGIDIEQVGLVINYDIPNTPEQYIHRVGRSGRYGKTGVAINFRTSSDIDKINMENVVRIYGIEIIYRINIAEITGYLSGPKGYNYKNI